MWLTGSDIIEMLRRMGVSMVSYWQGTNTILISHSTYSESSNIVLLLITNLYRVDTINLNGELQGSISTREVLIHMYI